ncbi:hypothetical protein ABT160_36360 [Streptomyces sp. NPDC001941]|uniref:hypothetical protein n=1 Tax=Streptomyces sp. NPDC001941 TaxID=3154659 RepID=UPI0033239419
MNNGMGGTYNSASFDSTVGIQAETVHNSNVYFVHPDASPQEKYKVGVRFLEDGIPSRARDMISDAIAHGYDNAEVRFYWVLAMLSARALHDLNSEDVQRLQKTAELVPNYAEGEWKEALSVAFDVLEMFSTADGETDQVLKRLLALSPRQRDAMFHHLDLVLTGGLKDSLWAGNREQAETDRFGNERVQRVWSYFEPDPIGPRALPPRPSTAAAAKAALPVPAGLFVISAALLWVLALVANPVAASVQISVALAAALAAAHFGRRWWYRERQIKAKSPQPQAAYAGDVASAEDGFTKRVRHSFDHYFSVRAPYGFTPNEWLGYTVHIRSALIAEIAFVYRESRISVDRVNWLIRYLAEDARDRHNNGTLFDRRHQGNALSVVMTKVLCTVALVALGITTLILLGIVASGSGSAQILLATLATAGVGWSGQVATSFWLEAWGEERRLAEESLEHQGRLAARQGAYQRWKSFLDSVRPSELEMENWLTCDKTLFVDEALRNYQLTWRDLITHTILVTPARPYKRGRVRGGPWRYSRYSFRLFLVTQDGVREVSAEFDFADAKRGDEQRSNYRFDALSSVQVTERSQIGYDLELVLTNGPARRIRVKDADTHQMAPDENAQEISEINLNSAGFIHTFRLLEGIAADGKGWIERINPNNLPHFRVVD